MFQVGACMGCMAIILYTALQKYYYVTKINLKNTKLHRLHTNEDLSRPHAIVVPLNNFQLVRIM